MSASTARGAEAPTKARPARLLRLAIAIALAAAFAIAALQLAQVDAPLGSPRGPDRIVEAIPADADAAADLKAAAAAVLADRPVDGRGFRLLAQRAELEGQGERARELYRIAVERAPRDRLARAKLLEDALVAGNYNLAGEHVDALLRVMPTLGAPLLATLVQSLPAPALQAVLAPRLASDPPWRPALATALRQDDVDPAAADALLAAQAEREEAGAVGQRDVGQLGRLLDEDRGESGGEQQRGGNEREQLAVAGAHSIWSFSSAITRSSASSRERSLWSMKPPRRAGGTSARVTPER